MSCAFLPCDEVARCALEGGCVVRRFPGQQPRELEAARRSWKETEGLKPSAPALNGTKARASRDPRFVPRRRKAISR